MKKDNRRVLLVGEKGLDRFVYGSVEKLSPEAPVAVIKIAHVESNPGMAGNVQANIESLGGPKVDFVHQAAEIIKTRYVDEASGQHLLRVDEEPDVFEPELFHKLIDCMLGNKDGYSAIVISSYDKGLLSTNVMSAIADVANELNVPIWCDTKAILGEWSKNIDFIKINDKEYKAQLRAGVTEPWKWCRNLIVTRGKEGMDLYGQDGSVAYHVDSCAGSVWSVSGAGDSVLAALVVKYLHNGGNIKTAMEYASRVAAVAISKPGVVAVKREEVDSL